MRRARPEARRRARSLGVLGVALGVALPARAAPIPEDLEPQVDALARGAEEAGLPGDRLRAKAQEGAAKGIPSGRVLAVLEQMRQRMSDAAAIIDAAAPKGLEPAARRALVG